MMSLELLWREEAIEMLRPVWGVDCTVSPKFMGGGAELCKIWAVSGILPGDDSWAVKSRGKTSRDTWYYYIILEFGSQDVNLQHLRNSITYIP
jgi:hypothetical protein